MVFSHDLKNEKRAASYFTNLVEVRRVAMEHHLPFWNIVSSNEIRPKTPIPSPANFQLQAYTTLAADARGLSWFTYYTEPYHYGPIDENGHRTSTWSYLRMVNEPRQNPRPGHEPPDQHRRLFHRPAARSIPSNTAGPTRPIHRLPMPLMLGEFAGPTDSHYIMIVNLSLQQSAKIVLTMQHPPDALRIISPVDGSAATTKPSNGLWLTAGEGELIELR